MFKPIAYHSSLTTTTHSFNKHLLNVLYMQITGKYLLSNIWLFKLSSKKIIIIINLPVWVFADGFLVLEIGGVGMCARKMNKDIASFLWWKIKYFILFFVRNNNSHPWALGQLRVSSPRTSWFSFPLFGSICQLYIEHSVCVRPPSSTFGEPSTNRAHTTLC